MALPAGFFHAGWLDARTVIGYTGQQNTLAYVSLDTPASATSLGFQGVFVGAL